MGRKVEINYSKVKEISDLGLSIKETLERLHECNINISRMQYYRWKQNNVTSSNNVTSNSNTKLSKKCDYVTKNNVTNDTIALKKTSKSSIQSILKISIKSPFLQYKKQNTTNILHLDQYCGQYF